MRNRRRWLLIAVFAAVIGTDQAVKWWAWRHIDGTLVNAGGYILLGPVVRSWWSSQVSGAVLDVLGGVVMILSRRRLLRRHTIGVLVGGGMVVAGWMSNLLDRLAIHYWTAPGSMRGVVDFIPSGGTSRCNVADLWIVAGALLLGYTLVRHRSDGAPHGDIGSHPTSRPSRLQVAELVALLVLVTLAVIGAVHYDGVAEPPEPATA